MPELPSHLTISDRHQASVFLNPNDFHNRCIFNSSQFISSGRLVDKICLARRFNRSRAQQAAHVIGAKDWTVVGRYEMELAREQGRWRLSSLRLVYKYQSGDLTLPEEARRRATQTAS